MAFHSRATSGIRLFLSVPVRKCARDPIGSQSFTFRCLHHNSHASFTPSTPRPNKLPGIMDPLEEFRQYLEGKRGSSDRTVRAYLTDVTMALSEMDTFETTEIETYLSSLSGRGTARSTVARKLAALRAYGDYLSFNGSKRENPASRVAAPHRSFRVASDDYSRQRDRTLQEIARMTGLQTSEIVSLNAEDIDWRQGAMRVPDASRAEGSRSVPLGTTTRLLRAYLAGRARGPLFLSASGDRLSVRLAHDIINQAAQA
jgi:integrase/recombinase XerC